MIVSKSKKNHSHQKKLLFVAPTNDLSAGGEISHFALIKSARKRGYDPEVILPNAGNFSASLKAENIPFHIVPYTWWNEEPTEEAGIVNISAITSIAEIAKKIQADAIITNTLNIPWAASAATLINIPHVWVAREFPFYEFSYLLDKYDFIESHSNLLIANSGNVAAYMKKELGLKNTKYFYSYVDTVRLSLGSQAKESPRLVCVGNIQSRKNQVEILNAVGILKNKDMHFNKIVFIGHMDPAYKNKIDKTIQKYDLASIIEIIPFSKDPWRHINKHDIFVQSSISESIGRTTTEAMKLGLICVGSDIPGTREAFSLGGGVLYESGNPNDLATKLANILNNPKKHQALAKDAQKNALKNMSEKACHDPFFTEIEKIFSLPNPQKGACNLYPYLDAAMKNHEHIAKQLAQQQEKNRELTQEVIATHAHLKNIVDSRAWKITLVLKKLLGR